MMHAARALEVFEAAALDDGPAFDARRWADRVGEALAEAMAPCVYASLLELDEAARSLRPLRDDPPEIARLVSGGQASLGPSEYARVYGRRATAQMASEVFGGALPAEAREAFGSFADVLGLAAPTCAGRRLTVAFALDRVQPFEPSARARVLSLGAQLAAVHRVRAALPEIEASQRSSARGGGGLTERLRAAVRQLDRRRARAARRRDDDAALEVEEAMRSMLAEGWVFVPVSRGGSRTTLVAVRLPEQTERDLRALPADERAVVIEAAKGLANKAIADRLGLHEPTVATRLRRAQQRLGLSRRTDLVHLFGGLA